MKQHNADSTPAKTHQERSWRSLIYIVIIALVYVLLRWFISLIFPSVPCKAQANTDCQTLATIPQLLALGLVSLMVLALAVLRLPLIWQETTGFRASLKWFARGSGLIVWLWLLSSTVAIIATLAGRFIG